MIFFYSPLLKRSKKSKLFIINLCVKLLKSGWRGLIKSFVSITKTLSMVFVFRFKSATILRSLKINVGRQSKMYWDHKNFKVLIFTQRSRESSIMFNEFASWYAKNFRATINFCWLIFFSFFQLRISSNTSFNI
jgi:hypothetical protein